MFKMMVACILGVLLSCAPALSLPITDGQKSIMEKIEPIYEKGNDKATLKAVEKLLSGLGEQETDKKIACYIYIVDIKLTMGDHAGAKAALDAMQQLDPKNPMYFFVRTLAMTREGKGQEAFELCRKDARTQPDDVRQDLDKRCRNIYANSRRTSASKLWQAFSDNEVAAEDQYKNKLLAVEGKISRIETSPLGYPEVVFAVDRTGVHMVKCQFPKDARGSVAKLKKGQKVTVAGVCKSFALGAVVSIDGCWLLD